MDLGDLRYRIAADTSELDRAGDRMDGFTRSAQGAERQTDELGREVKNAGRTSQKATGQMQKGMRSVETATERASKQMVGLRSALGGIAGYLGTREIIQYSDAWNNAANQLRQVTDSASELAGVQRTLMGVANDTRSQFQSTANLYSRLARSTTELGLSQNDLVGLTKTINQSFAVSGATAEEASAAITQLSQGLAAGALRGDEFNSVAEQAPGILRAVAESLGVGIGELREFAATGGITAEILVTALQDASDTIENQFSKSVATFGQQMTVANNNLTAFIGSSGSLQGVISGVGGLIMGASMALSDYSTQIDITVGAIGGMAVAYGALRAATLGLAAAQAAWNAAVRANPYVLAATAIAATVGVLYSLRDATVEIGNTTARVGDYMVAAWQMTTDAIGGAWDMIAAPLSNAIMSIADVFGETSDNSAGFWSNAMDTVLGAGRATVNGLIGLFRGLSFALAQIIYNISDSFANLFTGISDAASSALDLDWEGVKEAMNRELINPLNGVMDAFVGQQKDYLGEWGAAWTTRVSQNTAEFQTLDKWLLKGESSIKKVGTTSGQTAKQLKSAAKAASQFDDSLRGLLDRIDPLAKSQRDFLRDQALLQTALLSNKLTTEEYFRAVDQLSNSYENAGYWADEYGVKATSATQSVRDEADAMGVLWENTMERMDDAAVDMWRSFLDGSEDAFSSFKNLALDTLAEIIHAYTTQQITASLGLNIAGGGTRASGTGSMGGMGDIQDLASLGSKAWDYGSSLLGGGSSAGGLYANAATAGGLYSTAATGSAVTGGLYGSVATGVLAGNTSMLSSTMPYVGAAMLADSVLGLGIMDGIGGAISSLFGGGKKKFGISLGNQTRNEDGYSVDSLLGNVGLAADNSKRSDAEDWAPLIQQVAQAQDQVAQLLNEQQQAAVRSDLAGYMTYSLTSSDDLREEQVQNLMDSYMSEVIKSAVRNSGSAFADAIIAENSDNDAMYQELSSALNLDTILDGLSDNVRDYADKVASETSGDVQAALDSVLASIQNYAVVSDAAKSLNLQFNALADGAIEASNALVEAAGGLETLQSLQSSYYSNFFSESEQAARLQQQLTDQFEALNMTLPESRDEFRAIVEGLDLATDRGRETYVAMLNLSDSFAQITSESKAAAEGISEAARSLYSGGAVDSISGFLGAYNLQTQASQERIEQLEKEQKAIGTLSELMDSLLLSNQSILNPMERLQESQRQFAQLQVRAENGDTDAVSQLKGASSSYLDAAAAYYGQGSSQYAAIFGEVTDSVSGLEDQFSASLDGITDGNSIAGQQLAEQQRARQTLIDQLQTQIGMLDGINTFSDLVLYRCLSRISWKGSSRPKASTGRPCQMGHIRPTQDSVARRRPSTGCTKTSLTATRTNPVSTTGPASWVAGCRCPKFATAWKTKRLMGISPRAARSPTASSSAPPCSTWG